MTALFGNRVTDARVVSGGLSDARVWRVDCGVDAYALRRTPAERLSAERVVWLHAMLRTATHAGARFVCEPLKKTVSEEFVRTSDGAWWTATEWRFGEPLEPQRATAPQQRAAVAALAAFHGSLADTSEKRGEPRAVRDRIAQLADPLPGGEDELAVLADSLRDRAASAIERFAGDRMMLQAVQVDSRPEHFLLTGKDVTGLVDFAAMRVDTPAVDVARLAGELAIFAPASYAEHLAQVVCWYNETAIRSVSADLVAALDLSGAVVAADNWRNWFVAGRVSMKDEAVSCRTEGLRRRLRGLSGDE